MVSPEVLSLHYTARCDRNCHSCYLKAQIVNEPEISKQEWLALPQIARQIGASKIAIAFNFINVALRLNECYLETIFLYRFIQECRKYNILVDITTESSMSEYVSKTRIKGFKMPLEGTDVFSISFDKNKEHLDMIGSFGFVINGLKRQGAKNFNVNWLLTKDSIDWATMDNWKILFKHFDTIHLILQKPFPYTRDEYYTLVERLESCQVFEDDRFIIDPCFMLRLGLISHCHSCQKIIDINPYGSISGCAYNHRFSQIGKVKKLSDIVELLKVTEQQVVSNCQHLEFYEDNEIHESKRSKSNPIE